MNSIHLSNQEIISCYLRTLGGLEHHKNDMGEPCNDVAKFRKLIDCLQFTACARVRRLQWSGKSVLKMAAFAFSQALLILQCLSGQDSHISAQESKPSPRYRSIILCSNYRLHLTFIGPSIANIFSEYKQRVATILNIFISVRRSTCYGRFFRLSSGAQNCI